MKAGDVVELRSPAEVLASLDDAGSMEGVPFMPEMLEFFGRRMRVTSSLDRVCDTIQPIAVRSIPAAVVLGDSRCSGSGHGGCQSQCRIFWKEAWLRPEGETATWSTEPDPAYRELERVAIRNAQRKDSDANQPVFRCQATDLQVASTPVRWWDIHSLLRPLVIGNVGLGRFVHVMLPAILVEIAKRLRLVARFPVMRPLAPDPRRVRPAASGRLEVGQLVRVRTKQEIAMTLDTNGKNKGLWFDREMLAYCGKVARVRTKVERFVDERTGRLVHLESDCYILAGFVCTSDCSDGRWFCPRATYAWWRECWLDPLEEVVTGVSHPRLWRLPSAARALRSTADL